MRPAIDAHLHASTGPPAPATRRAPGRAVVAVVWFALASLLLPSPALAFPDPPYLGPPDGFVAAESEHIRFFVEDGAPMSATTFADAVGPLSERVYTELTTLFPPLRQPIEVRAYADDPSYLAATGSMKLPELATISVVADPGVGDVALAIPRFVGRSPLEAENELRHAIAHVVVRRAAAGRLPRGFDEGFAEYVEKPLSAKLARGASALHGAYRGDTLLTWSDLNRPISPNIDPELAAAYAYGIVAFLIERHGLRTFAEFVMSLREEPDWRTAMRTVYKRSPAELEEQWQASLPRWAAGGWRENLFAAFDLQPARDLLAKAHYAAAKRELERSLRLFTDLGDTARQAEVEGLLHQGDLGLQAEALMSQTQQALESHTYDRAMTIVTQARAQFGQLPVEQRPDALLGTYEELARSGLQAITALDEAQRLSHRWSDYPEARAAAVAAGAAFARLGDAEMWQQTEAVLAELDARQRRLVLMLGALAALTIAWLALWLWARGPAELEWS